MLPKYVSAACGCLDQPWPGHLRSAYGAICCRMLKPQNITDGIFAAQILGAIWPRWSVSPRPRLVLVLIIDKMVRMI
jgi:hypothetical protein